ncbi:MAG: hypothetical protein ACYSWP_24035 [Planctomycetota bacterium]
MHITADNILPHYRQIMDGSVSRTHNIPKLSDGRAVGRIAGIITEA